VTDPLGHTTTYSHADPAHPGDVTSTSDADGRVTTYTYDSAGQVVNGFGVLFVIFNAFGLGLRLPVGKLLARAFAQWKIAVCALVINFVVIPLLS
jgi:RHS Repeat